MPDPERILRTLRQALLAFRNTPGRRGRVVSLSGAGEILVGGDLHGNLGNFQRLMQRANLGQNPGRHLVVQELVHGPHRYPTGGDKSHQLLDVLAAFKCQYPRQVHMLLGNHELAEWTGQLVGKADQILNHLFREGLESAYGERAAEVNAAYHHLFATVPLAVRTPNRVFLSHSLPKAKNLEQFNPTLLEQESVPPVELKPGGTVHSLLWGRDTQPDTVRAFLAKVDADWLITGHIPCDEGFAVPNDRQLILDSLKTPGCCCLFPMDRPLVHAELIGCVETL